MKWHWMCDMALGVNKAKLTETDIITKFILPAIQAVGWDDMTQIRQEVKLRDGKVIVRGQMAARKTVKSADIVLYHKPSMPLAVIEDKPTSTILAKVCNRRSTTPIYWMCLLCLRPMAMVLSFMTKPT